MKLMARGKPQLAEVFEHFALDRVLRVEHLPQMKSKFMMAFMMAAVLGMAEARDAEQSRNGRSHLAG